MIVSYPNGTKAELQSRPRSTNSTSTTAPSIVNGYVLPSSTDAKLEISPPTELAKDTVITVVVTRTSDHQAPSGVSIPVFSSLMASEIIQVDIVAG